MDKNINNLIDKKSFEDHFHFDKRNYQVNHETVICYSCSKQQSSSCKDVYCGWWLLWVFIQQCCANCYDCGRSLPFFPVLIIK